MIVVSDTSPLIALHAIGRLDLLEALYREILIPVAVNRDNEMNRDTLLSSRLLKNTVRADPSSPWLTPLTSVRPERRARSARSRRISANGVSGVSHGVEACKPLIGLRPVFRLRLPQPVLSEVEGLMLRLRGDAATLSTNGLRGIFQQPARIQPLLGRETS